MNPQINQLVKSLLQKDSIEECSVQELQQFADRHPYFGAAQLLLTKKLQVENPERYDEQLQKTFSFFHNPLWVEHLLNDTGNATVTEAVKKEETPLVSAPAIESFVEKVEVTEEPIRSAETHEEFEEVVLPVNEEPAINIPQLKIEALDPNMELTFEPFHTVDYFASQGIKFKEDEKPKDKFGVQLKSFTDWLKSMKRLPVSEIAKTVETKAEQKVEQMAEHSLDEKEVVTEAMAEVWEKQGNMAKAIAVYTKLSLLEPSKSPYFAAKIEDLKKIN